jgi:hypothetical protein
MYLRKREEKELKSIDGFVFEKKGIFRFVNEMRLLKDVLLNNLIK